MAKGKPTLIQDNFKDGLWRQKQAQEGWSTATEGPPSTPGDTPGLPAWGASGQQTGQTPVKASRPRGVLCRDPPLTGARL